MGEWWQQTIENWDWAVFWPEVLGKAVGVALGVVVSWFLLIRRRLQAMQRLISGDSDDFLFQAHYLHHLDDGRYQLLFRSVAEKQTIHTLYDNPAAANALRDLGNSTSLNNPILPTLHTIGFEVLNDASSWISGSLATSPLPRDIWMFCLTAEDRAVVRKRCIRCFLIRPGDLRRFHDWQWCKNQIAVERPWHWFRVVALHRVARNWADQSRMFSSPVEATAMPLVDNQCAHRRIVALSLGLAPADRPIGPPVSIDWTTQLNSLAASGLRLENGEWPPDVIDALSLPIGSGGHESR